MSSSEMDRAIDHLLNKAATDGLALEVLATQRKATAIAFQDRKMDQFSFSETQQVGVRLLDGAGEGVAYSESLDTDSLDSMLIEARDNARMIRKEWISELHGPETLPELVGLYNPALEDVTVEEKVKKAALLESAALDFSSDIRSVAYTRYSDSASTVWIANSKGLRASYRQNNCMAYTYCLAEDGTHNVMDGEAELQQDFSVLDTRRIAQHAAEKTLARLGSQRPETGKYTVVFENRAAEAVVGLMERYFSGKAVADKLSPLQEKLGQKVFSSELTFTDDPFYLGATGCRPFDEEGYASRKTTLVENGVVRAFLTNSVLARKLKLPHTASASRTPSTDLDVSSSNFVVKPGSHSFQDLLNADAQVLLVTDLSGSAGFRASSGDFSIPMAGHLYANGKHSTPLKDFLISGNILELFAAVEAVGNDVRLPVGSIVCPSLLVRGLNVVGKSSNGVKQ